ncbi:hypothetical protein [Natronococcus wangiae]|uniref:hypothetical protein n=1 Tax=Natronococcus wangiae TaxID=3068275 RepID=UPI00273E8515|nr:hypothetical protein [Natronococcus sp. AD5]
MGATFTDDDVGKLVETDDGEEVGVVAAIDGPVVRVSSVPTSDESDPLTPSIENEVDETRPIEATSVREITDDRIVLTDDHPLSTDTSSADRSERTAEGSAADELDDEATATRGARVDPDAVAERDPDPELDPPAADRRTDATVSADDELRRTDAAVDPDDDDARRSDVEPESDES